MPQKEMVFLNGKSCAFTGHRPHKLPWKYDETDSRCIMLKKILDHQIEILVNEGVTSFFSGMAEGVDQWAASSVLAQRVKNPTLSLHCILPWKGQEEKWSQAARKHYQEILRQLLCFCMLLLRKDTASGYCDLYGAGISKRLPVKS